MIKQAVFAFLMIVSLVLFPSLCRSATMTYDASLGTLPQSQGWQFFQDNQGGPTPPAPTVSGGILFQGPTTSPGYQNWFSTSATIPNFLGSTPFVVNTAMKIMSSTYFDDQTRWRTGYSIYVSDDASQFVVLGISDTGLRLSTDGLDVTDVYSSPFYSFNTTSAFNTYKLYVNNGQADAFVNGNLVLTKAIGGTQYPIANELQFGDLTDGGSNQSQIEYLNYGSVPEPVNACILVVGTLALLSSKRRAK